MEQNTVSHHPGCEEKPRNQKEEDLHRIEWMLTNSPGEVDHKVVTQEAANPTQMEERDSRLIIDAVGKTVLEEIMLDTLNLLGTSAAVYEKDGTCSMGIFSSGWCQYLDNSFRNDDKGNDMENGGFLCHHRCWSESTRLIQETNGPVDRPCPGGFHIYVVPIKANGEIVGSINIGYGDPPQDPQILTQIADQNHLDGEQLIKAAQSYGPGRRSWWKRPRAA